MVVEWWLVCPLSARCLPPGATAAAVSQFCVTVKFGLTQYQTVQIGARGTFFELFFRKYYGIQWNWVSQCLSDKQCGNIALVIKLNDRWQPPGRALVCDHTVGSVKSECCVMVDLPTRRDIYRIRVKSN